MITESHSTPPARRRPLRLLSAVAVSIGLLFTAVGFAPSASAASAKPVIIGQDCMLVKHSKPFFGTKQSVKVTNICHSTRVEFRLHNWGNVWNSETTRCFSVPAGQTAGWKWTKGRPYWELLNC